MSCRIYLLLDVRWFRVAVSFDPPSLMEGRAPARQKESIDVREPLPAEGNAIGEIAATRSLKHAAPLGVQQERSIARIRFFEILS
jgi:hypothetical protein